MLKRIKEIQGVGAYLGCKAAAAEFRHTTLIFGGNSIGKSTLCEIFRSLANNDSSLITSRRTIPVSGDPKVQLSFGVIDSTETPVVFENGEWQSSLPKPLQLAVFDSGFIARNLFTGTEIDRKNKEALTDFVLGEDGVKRAEAIAQKRKESGQKSRELKVTESAFTGIADIPAFVNLVVEESESDISEALSKLSHEIGKIRQQREDIVKITARKELTPVSFKPEAVALAERIGKELGTSLDDVHEEVKHKLDAHIRNHLSNSTSAREWLRKGVSLITSDACPFCGQVIGEQAKELYEVFRKSFDDAYITKLNRMQIVLREEYARYPQCVREIESFEAILQSNNYVIETYPELVENTDFKQALSVVNLNGVDLLLQANKLRQYYEQLDENLKSLIESKRLAPHVALQLNPIDELRQIEELLLKSVEKYNRSTDVVDEHIKAFKKSVEPESLNKAMTELIGKTIPLSQKKKRLELDSSCKDVKLLWEEIEALDKDVVASQAELQNEQSEFLSIFFTKINYYFTKFGSNNFEIQTSQELDGKGHQPVITLIVKYKGKQIPIAALTQVLSESDKRALALSIFWAKIGVLSDDLKKNTIIVLDDPVTSFDDHRISVTMMEIISEISNYAQIIFLTHYRMLAHHMLVDMNLQGKMAFLQLGTSPNGTSILSGGEQELIHTPHHKNYLKIIDFINGNRQLQIDAELRVFMELEIEYRFRDAIHKHKLDKLPLGELIEELLLHKFIDNDVAMRLHLFRNNLNGPHHRWSSRTSDDWANLSQELLSFIYGKL